MLLSGGGAACTPTSITLTVYPLSTSCTGPSLPQQQAADQCLKDEQGTYFENFCNQATTATSTKPLKITRDAAEAARKMRRF
jgi:hypothetical protein